MQRAQAALEFMVTYGWALVLLVGVFSWIAYIGFSNPTELAGDDCQVSGEFGCSEAKLSAPSTLTASEASFVLRNLQSEKISVQEVIVEYAGMQSNCTRIQNLDGTDLDFVRSGEEFEVLCDDNNLQFVPGEKAKIEFTVKYSKSEGFVREAKGEIIGLIDDSQTEITFCGDGTPDAGEQCDAGEDNGVVCTPSYDSSCEYCSSNCESVTLDGEFCGDGIHNVHQEQCDDGANGNPLDGCTDECKFTACDKALVGDHGGCTNSIDSPGEIEKSAGHDSCTAKAASLCVSCNVGYEWLGTDCVKIEEDPVCGDDIGDGCTSFVDPFETPHTQADSSCSWSTRFCVSCNGGYKWNVSQNNCVPEAAALKTCDVAGGDGCTSSVEDGEEEVEGVCSQKGTTCVSCNPSYEWNSATNNCVPKELCPGQCDPDAYPTCTGAGDVLNCVLINGCYEEITSSCLGSTECEAGVCVDPNACTVKNDCKEFAETCPSKAASCSSGTCVCDSGWLW